MGGAYKTPFPNSEPSPDTTGGEEKVGVLQRWGLSYAAMLH